MTRQRRRIYPLRWLALLFVVLMAYSPEARTEVFTHLGQAIGFVFGAGLIAFIMLGAAKPSPPR